MEAIITSCVLLLVVQVCFFVALYYNVIISWSLFYFSQSFQNPLPWQKCPLIKNKTLACELGSSPRQPGWLEGRCKSPGCALADAVPECKKSSATTYYWYRKTLDVSDSISEGGGVNWKMALSLLVSWVLVCLAMIKGIKSSGKVQHPHPPSILPSVAMPLDLEPLQVRRSCLAKV